MQILTNFLKYIFHQADDLICVFSPDREVAVTETVTFQIKFERSKACVNAIEWANMAKKDIFVL